MLRFVLVVGMSVGCRSKGDVEGGTLQTDTGEACEPQAWYLDGDGDGYGGSEMVMACDQPSGGTTGSRDCDDTDATVHPDAEEVCDGIDNNCDGLTDNALSTGDLCPLEAAAIVLTGESSGDRAGYVVASAGDINSDGYDDVLIGAPGNDAGGADAGASYLLSGPITASQSLSAAERRFIGMADGDGAGVALDGGEDFDGDGIADLAIGAHWEGSSAYQAGAVYLFTGLPPEGDVLLSDADAIFLGESEDDWAGERVSLVPDASGDGLADLLISADRSDISGQESGIVYLISGPVSGEQSLGEAAARFLGDAEGDRAGSSSAGIGDLDGDGVSELGIGAWAMDEQAGRVHVVYGGDLHGDRLLSDADAWFLAESAGDSAGRMISSAGDISGDGLDDLLIGAPYHSASADEAGVVYVIFSAPEGEVQLADADVKIHGDQLGDTLGGHGGTGVGDLDGDGAGDLMLGVNNDDQGGDNAGAAHLIAGPLSGGVIDSVGALSAASWLGSSAHEEAGVSVAGARDTNGDGLLDVLVGGPETFGEDEGVAYLILGAR